METDGRELIENNLQDVGEQFLELPEELQPKA